jgi:hypothetical protein
MNVVRPWCPWGLAIYERIMDTDRQARRANQQRLRQLKGNRSAAITILCSHDAAEFTALQRTPAADVEPLQRQLKA